MNLRRPAAALLPVLLASCAQAPPPPPRSLADPLSDARRAKDQEIVALHDGRPLLWRAVAERAMETGLRHAVDQYVRGRIVEDRRAALGLVNTPAELRRRAEAVVRKAREKLGDAAFRDQLSREGLTEEAYLDHLAYSPLLDEALALEKIVRYEELRQGTLVIDRMIFEDGKDAREFAERCREKGFDGAADAFQGSGRVTRRPRESFPPQRPPGPPEAPPLDAGLLEALGRMNPGDVTGPADALTVIRLVSRRPGRDVPYGEAKDEVFEGILRDPPAPPELRGWLESEFAKAKIEYRDRRPARPTGR